LINEQLIKEANSWVTKFDPANFFWPHFQNLLVVRSQLETTTQKYRQNASKEMD